MHVPYLRYLILFFTFLQINGCATVGNSQFIKPSLDLRSYPLEINFPDDKILLIYNHGSTPELQTDPCYPNNAFMPGGMPSVVHNLAGKKIANKTIAVFAFCSELNGVKKIRNTADNLKIRFRIEEISTVVNRFKALGFRTNNIFLVGHSAGGWASLMIEAQEPESINGAIAFSPAFSGIKKQRNTRWQQFRDDQEAELKAAGKINALVYAFRSDAYNSLSDLDFFSAIDGVEYHPLSGSGNLLSCYRGHRGAFKRCFEETQTRTIIDFIQRNIN